MLNKTTITVVLSRKTHDELQALGRKGETFDELVSSLLERHKVGLKDTGKPQN